MTALLREPMSAHDRKALASTYNCEEAAAARLKLLKTPFTDFRPQPLDPLDPNSGGKVMNILTYYRIPGPELVNKSSPSCGLPHSWSQKHDRFIAYLATHAPLVNGKIPSHEMCKPRYTTEAISSMLLARFPELSRGRIKVDIIERRLLLLDYCENDFFRVEYGAYGDFEWGQGI
ncbi:hypothetical protein CJF30_00008384 [Rutstroemia sp. NJR-2017a BBW]|nr:hypothetical protein CJF30_00008384 [Rutstroemia sp. NJR-2017a BBW]